MSDRRGVRALAALFAVGVALRAAPLFRSSLPFNPDGIVYAGHVRLARSSGQLPLSRMPVDDLHFTALLTVTSAVSGESALHVAQPSVAVIGAVPVLVAGAVARRIAVRGDGDPAVPTALAGGLLAVGGLTLHRTMAVDEQTLGLVLVPVGLVAYARARRTGRRAWYGAAALCAVALPPVHNLDTVVFGLALLAWAALNGGGSPRARLGDVAAAAGFWLYAVAYFWLADRLTPAYIIQSARLTDALDLFVAWAILAVFALAAMRRARARTVRGVGVAAVCLAFGLLGINAVVAVFPGLPVTPVAVLAMLLPLAIPSVVAAWTLPDALDDRPDGTAVVALAAAVVVVVGFSLTASLTAPYLNSVYRVQTFAHLPWAVIAAVALGGPLARVLPDADRLRGRVAPVVAAVLLVCAAASVPVAFAGLKSVPYKGVTDEAEFAGMDHAVTFVPGPWSSDDHVVRIAAYHDRGHSAARAPVATWLRGGRPPDCAVVSQQSWTTVGAQQFPASPVAVDPVRYRSFLDSRHLVFDAGTADRVVASIPVADDGDGC